MNAYKAKELKSRSRGNCNNLRVLPPRNSGGTPLTITRYLQIHIVAIESDRSTEFKVLCSAEQVKKMKERNQIESEKLKRKREKAEEEKRKYKDKVPTNQRLALIVPTRTDRYGIQRFCSGTNYGPRKESEIGKT